MVTRGSTCERITLKEECEEAASQLGLPATHANTYDKNAPFCFYDGKYLFFNNDGNTASLCNSNIGVCICKETSGKQ